MRVRTFGAAVPTAALFAALATLAAPPAAGAQILDKIKDTAEEAAEGEVLDQVDRMVRDAVRCAFDDLDCIEQAKRDGEPVVLTDRDGTVIEDEEGKPVTDPERLPPGKRTEAYASYDFEPGERTLFRTDLEAATPGDFPRRLAWLHGNMQVVETQDGRFLRAESSRSAFAVPLDETLPERFTIEFEATDPHGSAGIGIALRRPERVAGGAWTTVPHFAAARSHGSGIYSAENRPLSVTADHRLRTEILPVRIMVDGRHAKMFIGRKRVANAPRVELGRSDSVYFFLHAYTSGEKFPMVRDIRVAAGGRDLYEALESDGRVAVRDILFDTGEASIRPESEEVLSRIAAMLEEHPGMRLLIEGHTDATGDFDANMELSADRAAAVKRWLVERHGIDGPRLRTMGLGPTQPVASNDTEAGRQNNRRVELVRVDG